MYVYILELENDKFYVGRTSCLKQRLADHVKGVGSVWTQLHKPQKVLKVFETRNPFFEDMIVLSFMKRYGRENVRGGSFSMMEFGNNMNLMISTLMRNAFDECLKCGGSHFAKDCGRVPAGQKSRSQEKLTQEFDIYMKNIVNSEQKPSREGFFTKNRIVAIGCSLAVACAIKLGFT